MPGLSAYPLLKAALVTRLQARAGLLGVTILDHVPVDRGEVRQEFIYLAGAEGSSDDVVFCAGDLRFDETITIDIVAEVHGFDTDDTQPAVDARTNQLAYEVIADIADQENWNLPALGLDIFDYLFFTPSSYAWGEGRIQTESVFAANVAIGVTANARRTFT